MNDTLVQIQSELKAPKGQFNKFGGYNYRNCEDILEAVKPLLKKHNLTITISDDIVAVNDRIYVKATARLSDSKGNEVSASALAREADTKKGMDEAQITGAASSYARKYALNGLFAIDDTKDADSHDNRQSEPRKAPVPKLDDLTKAKVDLSKEFTKRGMSQVQQKGAVMQVLKKTNVDTVEEVNEMLQALEDGII